MANTRKKGNKRVKVGEMCVFFERNGKYSYWVADCRKELIEKDSRIKKFPAGEDSEKAKQDALNYAAEQNAIFLRRKINKEKPLSEFDKSTYALALSKVEEFRVKEFDADYHQGLRGEQWADWDINKALDVAHYVMRDIIMMNKWYGEKRYSVEWALRLFREGARNEKWAEEGKSFEFLIDAFLRFKLSDVGGKGRKELDQTTKWEWQRHLGLLKAWIGNRTLKQDVGKMRWERQRILDRIDAQQEEKTGAPWGPATKRKCAQKIKEFGSWLCETDQGYVKTNPFADLPSKYNYAKDNVAKTFYTNEEVRQLFRIAMSDKKFQKLIPYLTFAVWAGLRPDSEIAKPRDSKRRFSWEQLTNKTWPEVGGFQLNIPAEKSKISYSRNAYLSDNGKLFLEWYAENVLKDSLPEEGDVFYSRRILDRLKSEFGNWKQDAARHTFCSNALAHWPNQGAKFWCERAGHSETVFRKYYQNPADPKEAAEFFQITPTSL